MIRYSLIVVVVFATLVPIAVCDDSPKLPNVGAVGRQAASDANKIITQEPPAGATEAERSRLQQERESKLTDLFHAFVGHDVQVTGTLMDVVDAAKLERKITDAPLVAVFQIPVSPPPELAAEWSREVREHSRYWDSLIAEALKADGAANSARASGRSSGRPSNVPALREQKRADIQATKAKQQTPVLVVLLAGTEKDFSGWRREQQKTISATIDVVSGTQAGWTITRDGQEQTWYYLRELDMVASTASAEPKKP